MEILLVEDERSIRVTLRDDLEAAGHTVIALSDGKQALDEIKKHKFDCIITDVRLPGVNGIDILKYAKAKNPSTEVIIITGFGTIEQTVEAMKSGAYDYIQKPFPNEVIVERVSRMARFRLMEEELEKLKAKLEKPGKPYKIVGRSRKMLEILDTIATIAPSDATVLITGESGTGKELVARALHELSHRNTGPFVGVSCAALPASLIEDELFGHEKGAFTDAKKIRKGRFELANKGTIFLDDIDDIDPQLQVKLLRVLQERSFERIGGEGSVNIDVRVIAATKVSLKEKVDKGEFREDLYYRLNVVPITLPPLRERKDDIPILVQHFIEKYGKGKEYIVPADVLEEMEKYSWPGNVRELENHVARAIAFAGGDKVLKRKHLLPSREISLKNVQEEEEEVLKTLNEVVKEAERNHIKNVLEKVNWKKTKAAEILGISRKTLWEKMKDYGLE